MHPDSMCKMPTFGLDRIRKFWHDVTSRKKLAAWDYKAFLQVRLHFINDLVDLNDSFVLQTIMLAFEGLLPLHHNQTVADLLFELANWHALAKLHLHTDITLDIFRAATETMYAAMRNFEATTCAHYTTHELPSEAQARARRDAKSGSRAPASSSPKRVRFNVMNTFKYHSLGDYLDWIARSGPTDNYTTQVVSTPLPMHITLLS